MNRFGYMQTATLDPVEVAKQKEAKKNFILKSSYPHNPHPVYPSLNPPAVVALDKAVTEEMTRAEIRMLEDSISELGYDYTQSPMVADILILEENSSDSSLTKEEMKKCKKTLQLIPINMFFTGHT